MNAEVVTRIENENVLIQIGDCAVTILPHLGGKISSILVKGNELLQVPLAPYGPRTRTMSFDQSDASGWDECLPSVAACTVVTAAGPGPMPVLPAPTRVTGVLATKSFFVIRKRRGGTNTGNPWA